MPWHAMRCAGLLSVVPQVFGAGGGGGRRTTVITWGSAGDDGRPQPQGTSSLWSLLQQLQPALPALMPITVVWSAWRLQYGIVQASTEGAEVLAKGIERSLDKAAMGIERSLDKAADQRSRGMVTAAMLLGATLILTPVLAGVIVAFVGKGSKGDDAPGK